MTEKLWDIALSKIKDKKEFRIDPEHQIVLEYRAVLETKPGKVARKMILEKHGISLGTLYRWLKIYDSITPWEKTYRGIVSRCKGDPLYLGQGIKCRITVDELRFLWERDGAEKMENPSIDRIDPAGDYVLENCRYLEFRENAGRARHRTVVEAPRPHYDTEVAKALRRLGDTMGSGSKAARALGVSPRAFYFWSKGMKRPQTPSFAMLKRIRIIENKNR